ncbi:MAG TPA: phosphate/phosphite/phosphonate ABC transporter substrate-binding protein, partial [Anaerolineaceae bacterium]
MKVRLSYLSFALLMIGALLMASCSPAATPTQAPATAAPAQPTAAPVQPTAAAPAAAPTTAPTAVAAAPTATTPPPDCSALPNPVTVKAGDLGSPDNPIVMAFVPSGDSGKIAKASTAIADCLDKMTGLTYKIQVGTSYRAAADAMGAGKAQVGFLNTFTILYAEEKYGVLPVLANLRKYSTTDLDPDKALKGQLEPFYKGQFIANVASGIKQLSDLKGKTFCFVEPASTSGYIVPRIILKANGIDPDKDFKATTNAGSHPNVAIAVYKGD